MKYSFIIIVENIKKIKQKVSNINLNESEILLVSSNEFDDYKVFKTVEDAVKASTGKYINISGEFSFYTSKSLNKLNSIINNKCDIYCFEKCFYDGGPKDLNVVLPYGEYNIEEENINIVSYIDQYFFKRELFLDVKFSDMIEFTLLDILDKYKRVFFINNNYCYYKDYFSTNPKTVESTKKEWYLDYMDNYVLKYLNKKSSRYVQAFIYYLIVIRYTANAGAGNKMALSDKELVEFEKKVKKALSFIEDTVIMSGLFRMNYNLLMLKIKHDDLFKRCSFDKEDNLINKDNEFLCSLNRTVVTVDCMDNRNGKVHFDCSFYDKCFIDLGAKLVVELNGKEIEYNINNVYASTLFFGNVYNNKFTFDFYVSYEDLVNSEIKFYIKKEIKKILNIEFSNSNPQSRLTNMFTNSYWMITKKLMMTLENNNTLYSRNINCFGRFIKEIKLYKDFLTQSKKKKLGIQSLGLRIIYRVTKPFFNRDKIWITFDKLYKAGDNGEYFYQHCLTRKDGYKCYYIINNDAYDYKRLKSSKYVLPLKSLKQHLVTLNCSCVFATHANVYNFIAFTSGKEKYFRDVMNFDTFCIQHGLTIQDIPHLQNRVNDNTKLYHCASEIEIKNIMQDKYDYQNYDAIRRVGLARYDGLKSKDMKQILITPTWRSNMANSRTVLGGVRPYYEEFKNTEYFKIFNSIINDKKLIDAAKEYGYRIVYLIHPTLTSQINDFDRNDYVDIFSVTEDQSYEKLLTESSVMVTDYSGVQYDFAYMRKKLIYFHPDELPAHYGSGIDFEKEGFGPIIKTKKDLVDNLCKCMKNNCVNEKKYIDRANKFFLFDDFNNCERIYDATVEFLRGEKR